MRTRFTGAALAAAAAATLAQEPQPTFRLDANYVRVDMYAMQGSQAVEDLRSDDIELLEDGVRQKVEAFEPVRVRPAAKGARSRILVVFFDTFHLQIDSTHDMRQPLVNLLEKAIGEDDLVGLMHPRIPATGLRLGPKTDVLAQVLTESWIRGEKDRTKVQADPVEEQWFHCYGPGSRLDEMVGRGREKMALDALEDLVTHLRGLREERKAVLLVSEGWQLYAENRRLASPPSGGTAECDAARGELATMDNSRRLRDLTGDANRANVSFYPVYPRELTFSGDLGQLRELAANTDGLAVVNTNDIDGAMRRIVADLTSYYLLGYYSTNTKADGKFRSITVRVKRPGVQVRARRGYRALTREERDSREVSSAVARAPLPESSAVSGILHRPDETVNALNLASLRHVVLWKRGPGTGREYVASEDPRLRRTERLRLEHATEMKGPATAQMLDAMGRPMVVPVQVTERPDPSGNYRWIVADTVLAPLAPGEYSIEVTIGEMKVSTLFQVIP